MLTHGEQPLSRKRWRSIAPAAASGSALLRHSTPAPLHFLPNALSSPTTPPKRRLPGSSVFHCGAQCTVGAGQASVHSGRLCVPPAPCRAGREMPGPRDLHVVPPLPQNFPRARPLTWTTRLTGPLTHPTGATSAWPSPSGPHSLTVQVCPALYCRTSGS